MFHGMFFPNFKVRKIKHLKVEMSVVEWKIENKMNLVFFRCSMFIDNRDNSNFADDARKLFAKMIIMSNCVSDDKLFYETIK